MNKYQIAKLLLLGLLSGTLIGGFLLSLDISQVCKDNSEIYLFNMDKIKCSIVEE